MSVDRKLVDIVRRDLLKMAVMTGTAGVIATLGEALSPTLAAVANLQQKGKGKPAASAKVDPVANDLGIINTAIQLEQKAINTYFGMEKEKLIVTKSIVEVARQFTDDHLAHREALIGAARTLSGTPVPVKGLGTFPIPGWAMKKEAQAVRFAMALELIASKIYFDAFKDKLRTDAGRNLIISILPVETQHVGVYRTVLKYVVDKNNKDNSISPYALLTEEPMPPMPEGFSWDFEKLS